MFLKIYETQVEQQRGHSMHKSFFFKELKSFLKATTQKPHCDQYAKSSDVNCLWSWGLCTSVHRKNAKHYVYMPLWLEMHLT